MQLSRTPLTPLTQDKCFTIFSVTPVKLGLNYSDTNDMRLVSVLFMLLTIVSGGKTIQAFADDTAKNLPLVFDPQTKKYFISGNSKFQIKQGANGGIVDRIEISVDGSDFKSYTDSIEFKDEG